LSEGLLRSGPRFCLAGLFLPFSVFCPKDLRRSPGSQAEGMAFFNLAGLFFHFVFCLFPEGAPSDYFCLFIFYFSLH
jgi:hypothetical protein